MSYTNNSYSVKLSWKNIFIWKHEIQESKISFKPYGYPIFLFVYNSSAFANSFPAFAEI